MRAQVLLRTPVGDLQINSPLVGRHNVYNILAAVATGLATTVRGKPVPLKARRALVQSMLNLVQRPYLQQTGQASLHVRQRCECELWH
jgi:hypothetical protein